MKLLGKVGLVALGAGLGAAGIAVAMKTLGYNVVKNEEVATVAADVVVNEEEVIVAEESNNETEENAKEGK